MREITKEDLAKHPRRVIRTSDWYFHETITTRGRGGVTYERDGVAENILCVGTDRIEIATNPFFLKRVYLLLYGSDKYLKRFNEKTLSIKKIVFKKAISLSNAPEYV